MDKSDHSWLSTVMFQLLTDFVVWLWLLWFSITHGRARRLDGETNDPDNDCREHVVLDRRARHSPQSR